MLGGIQYQADLRIDTVGVRGSNPHAPTISIWEIGNTEVSPSVYAPVSAVTFNFSPD